MDIVALRLYTRPRGTLTAAILQADIEPGPGWHRDLTFELDDQHQVVAIRRPYIDADLGYIAIRRVEVPA